LALVLFAGVFVPLPVRADRIAEARAHYEAGTAAFQKQDYNAAIHEFKRAEEVTSNASRSIALCYEDLAFTTGGFPLSAQTIEQNTGSARVKSERLRLFRKALEQYQRFAKRDPQHAGEVEAALARVRRAIATTQLQLSGANTDEPDINAQCKGLDARYQEAHEQFLRDNPRARFGFNAAQGGSDATFPTWREYAEKQGPIGPRCIELRNRMFQQLDQSMEEERRACDASPSCRCKRTCDAIRSADLKTNCYAQCELKP
jgi:tetratricopeptide (TPR) repeat protein